jgi:hypothetical protein
MKNPITPPGLTADTLDRLSLEQALIDVEVANARVIDLTERLTESSAEIQRLRARLGHFRTITSSIVNRFMWLRTPNSTLRIIARAVLPIRARRKLLRCIR